MDRGPLPIAFCITELDPGGAERMLVQVVTGLDRAEWTPRVYCLGPEAELAGVLRERGIDVECLGGRGPRDAPRVLSRLTRSLRVFRPVILQTFLFHANLLGRIAGWRAGVPVRLSGIRVAERHATWHNRLDRWTNSLVHKNVCVSQAVADFQHRVVGLPLEKTVVIPNGVDVERFRSAEPLARAELDLPDDALILLAVGRLDPQKGYAVLLDALEVRPLNRSSLLDQFPNLRLLIAGEGPERAELERRIDGSSLAGRVRLLGHRRDVPRLLRTADLFVLSSRWEGMPNVVLEAMAAGTPVVATDVEGVRELIPDPDYGWVVTARQPEGQAADAGMLAETIEEALSHPAVTSLCGENAQRFVIDGFTIDVMRHRYADLYRNLIENR